MKIAGRSSLGSFERFVRLLELEATIQLRELEFFK
jgi:hypothetical protein